MRVIPKILIPLWSTSGRDFQTIMPIVYYLEEIKGYDVKIISIWDWYIAEKYKPDLILFAGIGGGNANIKFAKYLKSKGYRIVSLSPEGNFREWQVEQFFWGLNKEKILLEDENFLWSQRCLNMVVKKYPQLKPYLGVSGAVGFDRYKIFPFMDKEDFLLKYNRLNYKKVLCYACYTFDPVRTDDEINDIDDKIIAGQIEIFKNVHMYGLYDKYLEDKQNINIILKNFIKTNPDILFILKLHPGTIDDENTEIKGLDYENVLVLKSEEEISDIINASDILMAFDSTTVLEAWLLSKPTIHLFPPEYDKDAGMDLRGSLIVRDQIKLQNYIDDFFKTGTIADFDNKKQIRDYIIKQIIQWDDGLNHVRIGEEIAKIVEQSNTIKQIYDSILTRIELYGIHLLITVSKYIKMLKLFNHKHYISHQVSENEILKYKDKYYPFFNKFHSDINATINEKTQ